MSNIVQEISITLNCIHLNGNHLIKYSKEHYYNQLKKRLIITQLI